MVAEYGLRRMAAPPLGERQIDHAAVFLERVASNADALRFRRRAKFDAASLALRGKDLRLLLRLGAGDLGFGFGAEGVNTRAERAAGCAFGGAADETLLSGRVTE